jgi:hypothetical protein
MRRALTVVSCTTISVHAGGCCAPRADVRRRLRQVAEGQTRPLRERFARFVRTMIRHRRAVRLATPLVLDDDMTLRTMPLRAGTVEALERDVEQGHLDRVDLDATHVALVSLTYGYVLYRNRFAAELGIPVRELDERLMMLADRMLEGLEPR